MKEEYSQDSKEFVLLFLWIYCAGQVSRGNVCWI